MGNMWLIEGCTFSTDIFCMRTYRLNAPWTNVWLLTTINDMVNYYGMWVILTNCVINWVARFPWEENLNQEVPLLLLLPHHFFFAAPPLWKYNFWYLSSAGLMTLLWWSLSLCGNLYCNTFLLHGAVRWYTFALTCIVFTFLESSF